MPKLSSPIPYHGGKHYLAEWIISKMPPHTRYVEPYFGGGSVLFAKEYEGIAEVVNDLDRRLTNFWRVMQDDILFSEFRRIMQAVPSSQVEFKDALGRTQNNVQRAVGLFIQVRQSHEKVVGAATFMHRTNRVRRGMHESASRWLSSVEGLPTVHHRLARVVIYEQDAIELIQAEDTEDTLFYCDPTYRGKLREGGLKYGIECDDKHHLKLLRTLGGIKGKFLLSGYDNKMYHDAARYYGWDVYAKEVTKHSSGVNGERPKAVEMLWCNY